MTSILYDLAFVTDLSAGVQMDLTFSFVHGTDYI